MERKRTIRWGRRLAAVVAVAAPLLVVLPALGGDTPTTRIATDGSPEETGPPTTGEADDDRLEEAATLRIDAGVPDRPPLVGGVAPTTASSVAPEEFPVEGTASQPDDDGPGDAANRSLTPSPTIGEQPNPTAATPVSRRGGALSTVLRPIRRSSTTDPTAAIPSTTGPAVTGPAITGPAITGPGGTEPAATATTATRATTSSTADTESTTTAATSTPGRGGSAWDPATVPVVDPRDFGAAGDGATDDTDALRRAIQSLDDTGGVVYIADGTVYRTTETISITGDHIKLWARSGRGTITADTDGARNSQGLVCRDNRGCGFHGLRLRSDSPRRLDALEDSRIAFDGTTGGEVVGVEIDRSASAAVFVFGRSREVWVEGNYLHHNWSDAIHFTNGSRRAWVWGNTIHNEGETRGDDGVACVTYGDEPHCGDMEWWSNTHLGTGWGRGYSVIGGTDITIHHNYARNIAAAGILVASEPSYDTPGSRNIRITDNVLHQTGQVVPHPGILISGLSGLIENVTVARNVVVDSANDKSFRREGETAGVDEHQTVDDPGMLPSPLPGTGGAGVKSTEELRMRDVSFVDAAHRGGLYRHHIRRSGGGFEERFEYVVSGPPATLENWATNVGGALTVIPADGATGYGILLSPQPVTLAPGLQPVGFAELRNSAPSAVWTALDAAR